MNAALNRQLQTDSDLSLPEYRILVLLSEAPDNRLRMSELADGVLSSRSRLTHQIRRMEDQHLVRRNTCEDDGRGVIAELTEEGMRCLEAAAPATSKPSAAISSTCSPPINSRSSPTSSPASTPPSPAAATDNTAHISLGVPPPRKVESPHGSSTRRPAGRRGRAAECTRLESERRESDRGFKSLRLRTFVGLLRSPPAG